MKVIVAISLYILWVLVVVNTLNIDYLQNYTITIKPAEVRKLMQECEGVFEIKEVNNLYKVRCVKYERK